MRDDHRVDAEQGRRLVGPPLEEELDPDQTDHREDEDRGGREEERKGIHAGDSLARVDDPDLTAYVIHRLHDAQGRRVRQER
jgi:hypothetical protein